MIHSMSRWWWCFERPHMQPDLACICSGCGNLGLRRSAGAGFLAPGEQCGGVCGTSSSTSTMTNSHTTPLTRNGGAGVDSLYILDQKGKVLISRHYRDVRFGGSKSGWHHSAVVSQFTKKVIMQDEGSLPPIVQLEISGKSLDEYAVFSVAYLKHSNLYSPAVVLSTHKNANAMLMLLYLKRLKAVFTHYFNSRGLPTQDVLDEESIKDNFVVIYELLDEMMDFGYVQSTETQILQEFIKLKPQKLNLDPKALMHAAKLGVWSAQGSSSRLPLDFSALGSALQHQMKHIVTNIKNKDAANDTAETLTVPKSLTGKNSWRREGIFYKKNEVFLDVIENVSILVSSSGHTLHSEINGVLRMKCHLSGMPDVKIGLNDKVLFENLGRPISKGRAVELEDVKFHQCVRLNRFEQDRTISFVPPDGEFDLMSYRLNTRIKPLILVKCEIREHSKSRIEYLLRAKAQFKQRSVANDVAIFVPVPADAQSPVFKSDQGDAEYLPEKNCIKWNISRFPGGENYFLRAQIGIPSMSDYHNDAEDDAARRKDAPIKIHFEIPYFTVSGLQVRYLKVLEKSGYESRPWVRYISRGGTDGNTSESGIEIRM